MLFVCVLACVRLPSHSLRRSRDTLKLSRAEQREEERQEIGRKTERKESR